MNTKGYARKVSQKETNQTTTISNYTLPHNIQNPNKPGKLRLLFDATTYFINTCFNDHFLSGSYPLNKLVGVLLRSRESKYAAASSIEQIFHQISVKRNNQDALRFLWQDEKMRAIEDHMIWLQVF